MYSLIDDILVIAIPAIALALKASAVRALFKLPRKGLASFGQATQVRIIAVLDCMAMLARFEAADEPNKQHSDSVTAALAALLHIWVRTERGRAAISIDASCVARAACTSREGWGSRAARRCEKVAAKTNQVDRVELREFAKVLEEHGNDLDLQDRAFYLRCWVPSPLRRLRESPISLAKIAIAGVSTSLLAFGLLHLSGEPSLLFGIAITVYGLLFASRSFDGRNRLHVSRGLTRSLRVIAFGLLLIAISESVDAVQHLRFGTLLVMPIVGFVGWTTYEFSEWSRSSVTCTTRLSKLISDLRIGLGLLAAAGLVWSATSLGDGVVHNLVVVAPTLSLAILNMALGDVELQGVTEPEPE